MPLVRAVPKPGQVDSIVADIVRLWNNNDPSIRQAFIGYTSASTVECAARRQVTEESSELWLNDTYQVAVRRQGGTVHLSIKRLDRQPVTDWRDKQAIKNQLVGPECEGIELYPAESRLVDSANQFHIWCSSDPTFRFPVGYNAGRMVTNNSVAGSVQRKVEA